MSPENPAIYYAAFRSRSDAVAAETARYFEDPAHAERTRAALAGVRARLGDHGASRRAAEQVLALCEARRGGRRDASGPA